MVEVEVVFTCKGIVSVFKERVHVEAICDSVIKQALQNHIEDLRQENPEMPQLAVDRITLVVQL